MSKRISGLILLIIMMICSVSLSVTYSKYLLSKNVVGEVKVPEVGYCLNKGINTLAECMLVMENYSESAEAAKLYISSKEVDLTNIAPTIQYVETKEEIQDDAGFIKTTANFTFSSTYTFNSSTGMFTLGNDYISDYMKDDYIDLYTCKPMSGALLTCSTLYQIKAYKTETNSAASTVFLITDVVVHEYNAVDSFDSEIGLYQSEDDYGASYYYRGNVKNNYVSYAGYMWRIIRYNSNGTIRMIYAGTDSDSTGVETAISAEKYGVGLNDPTYVGYMYDKNFVLKTGTRTVGFYNFGANTNYYFADDYEFDTEKEKFILTGNVITTKWNGNSDSIINNYPYTCVGYYSNGQCDFLLKVIGYGSGTTMNVNYISYSSKDYNSTLNNVYDSNVKKVIDTWYENNILNLKDNNGSLYSDYLSDEIFCNDRSLASGQGFSMDITTVYGGLGRSTPSLKCPQYSDKFTFNDTINGNGALTYPIGLINVDEIRLAGAKGGAVNKEFYLYNSLWNWTMTPYDYANYRAASRPIVFNSNGNFDAGYTTSYQYVRPVINLRSDIKITQGDGTVDNPYVVTI